MVWHVKRRDPYCMTELHRLVFYTLIRQYFESSIIQRGPIGHHQ